MVNSESIHLEVYDTTLRDGAQAEDVSFSVDDKIRIAQKLDELGIHFIEGGWPGANPRDIEFFQRSRRFLCGMQRLWHLDPLVRLEMRQRMIKP